MRPLLVLIATASAALLLAACGSEGISVPDDDPLHEGAELFADRCGGCHTIAAAGTQGSGNRALRQQGPNFDERPETFDAVLYAIQNGGFSGAIMPQNIVVGEEADLVARFVEEYSGTKVEEQPLPSPEEDAEVAAEESGNPPPASSDEDTSSGE